MYYSTKTNESKKKATHINKAACRKSILSIAQGRAHKFTRVGADVFEHLDLILINAMKNIVASHPSKGKTIMMGSKKRNMQNGDDLKIDD